MRHSTRLVARTTIALLAMTALSGCVATLAESAAALVTQKLMMDALSDSDDVGIGEGGPGVGGPGVGGPGETGGPFSPRYYATQVYPDIRFPPLSRGGVVEIPNRHINAMRNFQEESLRLVNARRAEAGSRALRSEDTLNAYATVRAMEIVNLFEHRRPDGSDAKRYIKSNIKAENIAMNWEGTPKSFIDQWMNSEGHRRNILNPDLGTMGIGLAPGGIKGGFYAAQIFGGDNATTNFRFDYK